ncbi:MAG: ribose-5-phosphate isomerase RpiA [Gammaproteobacteria bacterium TMED112]|nr:ribose-5-phosphate isomerase RpiA [Gammaproteobacteria bacterium]RPG42568.1 MAG: ribose-5-phosphate isomerase RpiA [Gammaproteobacteria bacterium TMED112]|tara:strand:- start:2553 stop:3212 length:660 start_codon:yes stop_codon:yes gene_type:complete
MSQKYNAALGAYEVISRNNGPFVLGVGTGSTTDFFTKEFLPKLREKLNGIYSSSNRTTNLLKNLGFQVHHYSPEADIDVYIDGADEVDKNFNLIKGGGGAHTNEKRLAKIADHFICIVDESKIVQTLGNFPLPVEIDVNQSEQALSELEKYSKNITQRESLSDSKNYLYDLHGLNILDPLKIENQILSINGVVDVGIFAVDKPQTVIIGRDSSYKLMES